MSFNKENSRNSWYIQKIVLICSNNNTHWTLQHKNYDDNEEYRAEVLQALLEAKNEDGTPAITPKEAQEALNGFTDDELQDGILWNSPQDVADIILEG